MNGLIVAFRRYAALSTVVIAALALPAAASAQEGTGSIAGVVFADQNANGVNDGTEPVLFGAIVFLDGNGNGAIDEGEPQVSTSDTGAYSFSGLAAGTYTVRQYRAEGSCNAPANCVYEVTLAAGEAATGRDYAIAVDQQLVLGANIGPGSARLVGPRGCRPKAFTVRVVGKRIEQVVFRLDGERVENLTGPNRGRAFVVRLDPAAMTVGRHRLTAEVLFDPTAKVKKRTKTMSLSFRRCR